MAYDQQRVMALLKDSLTAEATDILIKVPGRPMFRSAGRLLPTPHPEISPGETFQLAHALLSIAQKEVALVNLKDTCFSFGVQGLGRFRAHFYRQRGSLSVVIHRIQLEPPSLASLGAPDIAAKIAWGGPGLTLVAGQQHRLGLLAALTDHYNRSTPGHLVSIEDPVEFLHRDVRAMVSQREVGVDVTSVPEALRSLRDESPDAVILHDIPDHEVAEEALRAAERGLPVVAAVAGSRAVEIPRWFARMFPERRETEICERLCVILRGVIAERRGEVFALPVSPAVREAILKRRPLPSEAFGSQPRDHASAA